MHEQADMNFVFTPDEVGRITKMKISRMSLTENGSEVFEESVKMLKNAMQNKSATTLNTVDELEQLLNNLRNKG